MKKIEDIEEKLNKLIDSLSENEEDIQELINWREILTNYQLSEESLKKYWNYIYQYHRYICRYQKLTEDFIDLYGIFINWPSLSRNQYLTEDMMKKYCDELDWVEILTFQNLSEEFLTDFVIPRGFDVDWTLMCNHQQLSENFIKNNAKFVDWYDISISQTLSKEFMIEFANKLNFANLIMYQKNIDEDVIRAYSHEITKENYQAIAWQLSEYQNILNTKIIEVINDILIKKYK
jgi:hypothetical protein